MAGSACCRQKHSSPYDRHLRPKDKAPEASQGDVVSDVVSVDDSVDDGVDDNGDGRVDDENAAVFAVTVGDVAAPCVWGPPEGSGAMRTAIILVIAVVWSFSTSAAPLRLQDGFAGHPFETHVELKNGNASMYDKGWNKCGQSSTTEAPAFEFELTQPMDDLDVTVTALAVIVGPDGGFVCGKAKPVRLDRWPAGRWKIFCTAARWA